MRLVWAVSGAVLLMATPASAVDRAHLDRCQAQLTACYEACKAKGTDARTCDRGCTTDQCGLPWRESYGAYIDRRIEETAAQVPNTFVGLKKTKEGAHRD
jgi:hypothetical protein